MVDAGRNHDKRWTAVARYDGHLLALRWAVVAIVDERELGRAVTDEKPVPEHVVLVKGPDGSPGHVAHQVNLSKFGVIGIGGTQNLDEIAPVVDPGNQRNNLDALNGH